MIKSTKNDRTLIKVEHVNGGAGYIEKEELINGEKLGAHCRMFNQITLEPGSEIGYHEHHGEAETYYIIAGKGTYVEDGTEVEVEAGDVTYCADGHAHGLTNTGDETLVMIALILMN